MSKIFVSLALFILISSGSSKGENESDPVAAYYLNQADSVFNHDYIFKSEADFSFKVTSISQLTDYHGKLEETDTALYEILISNGLVKSVNIIDSSKSKNNAAPDSFKITLPWLADCHKYFFPNDTGVGLLAIGFELLDSSRGAVFSGMVSVDRDNFRPSLILVSYLDFNGFDRLSKTWEFEYGEPYIVIARQETQSVRPGFLGKEYFRQILIFSDYKFE
ncbi:MAG: hypothetical protein ABIJ45_14595 [Candidatus Zixiibacteriota bacterium]